ncbi:bone morphogenetic protein 2 isoform X1 [Lepeophtheirus salmonis]|uniref:bone morphogenetic protein 2 isoform X1 n=1 Tax=Lepeophtheirus salmonis TaxID=72036 RepID=UPI001AE7C357|nr:protein decapentaplegic-like isoform X1 [Lepeophtheirus salmonis]
MIMQLSKQIFILFQIITYPYSVFSEHDWDIIQSEIQKEMLQNMGLSKFPPKISKSHISLKTFEKANEIYEKSLQQTKELQKINEALNQRPSYLRTHEQAVLKPKTIASGIRRTHHHQMISKDFKYLKFDMNIENRFPTLTESALLAMDIKLHGSDASVEVCQVLTFNPGGKDDLIYLDKEFLNGMTDTTVSSKSLSISPAVQHWVQHPEANNGIKLVCYNCTFIAIGDLDVRVTRVELYEKRSKRSALTVPLDMEINTLCKHGPHREERCCRHSMEIDLVNITGFDFILHPKTVDAFFCHGRCPHRFNPKNDHSLFQSMMHIKTRNLPFEERIPRPCCAASTLQPLDILHASEDDETSLKVTKWKDVIVTECACT